MTAATPPATIPAPIDHATVAGAPPAFAPVKPGGGSTLRTPIRAAVAVTIALLVGHEFTLERSYWAVLVAVLLVNGTWGENTRKGLTRVGMTIVGCAAAWGLHAIVRENRAGRIAVLVVAIFFAAYYRTSSYPRMTFFVTVYVLFLFAILRQPTWTVVKARVVETFIGAAIALVASLLVPPPRATRQWADQVGRLRAACRRVVEQAFADLLDGPREPAGAAVGHAGREVLGQLQPLRNQYQAALYEGAFFGPSRDLRRQTMRRARLLAHFALALSEAAHAPRSPAIVEAFRDELTQLRDDVLRRMSDDESSAGPVAAMDTVQDQIRRKACDVQQSHALTAAEVAWLGPLVYYSRAIGELTASGARDGQTAGANS